MRLTAKHGTLTHAFVCAVPDGADLDQIQPTMDWNDEHVFSGGTTGALLVYDATKTDHADWTTTPTVTSLIVGAGTAFLPSLRFPDGSGFYQPVANYIALSTLPGSGIGGILWSSSGQFMRSVYELDWTTGLLTDTVDLRFRRSAAKVLALDDGAAGAVRLDLVGRLTTADGVVGAPAHAFASELTLGFWRSAAGTISVGSSTTSVVLPGAAHSAANLLLDAGLVLSWTGRVKISSPADTQLFFSNQAASAGIAFVLDANNVLKVRRTDLTDLATLNVSTVIASGSITAGGYLSGSASTGLAISGAARAFLISPADGEASLLDSTFAFGVRLKFDALPTIASGGGATTPAAVTAGSTPLAGSLNVGTGVITNPIVVNFNGTAFPSAPFAIAINTTTAAVLKCSATTTQLTITGAATPAANDVIAWHCISAK